MMLLNTVSTMTSECFFVRSETRETSSTSSAFVMLPVFIWALSLSAFSFPLPATSAGSCDDVQSCASSAARLQPPTLELEAGSWKRRCFSC